MMGELEKRYPDKRERSLIASVRLSLKRLPAEAREKIRGLAVFQGAANAGVMAHVLQVEPEEALDLCRKLIAVGLAEDDWPYLLLDPGLGTALSEELTADEREAAEQRWLEGTVGLVGVLYEQRSQDTKVALHGARVALVDLLNVLTKLERDVAAGQVDAAEAIGYVTNLEALVSSLGLPGVLARIAGVRRDFSERMPAWNYARFNAESQEVDRRIEAGDVAGALKAAQSLRDGAEANGDAYPEAPFDRARAWWQLGRVLREGRRSEDALSVLEEARARFSKLASAGNRGAAGMESKVIGEKGNALHILGRFDEAVAMHEYAIDRHKALGDMRSVAVGKAQLGYVRFDQGRLEEALGAYQEALAIFEDMAEPREIAGIWHQIGIVHASANRFEAAEHAYKKALAPRASQGDRPREAQTLHQLGVLYDYQDRLEDSAAFYRQSAGLARALGNQWGESMSLNNLGGVLHKLQRFDEAREALTTTLTIRTPYGHSAQIWTTWATLEAVERDAGQPEAALEARQEALRTYRAYRVDGGEPVDHPTRLISDFGQALRGSGANAARALLPDPIEIRDEFAPTLRALRAIAAGSRDPALAAALFTMHAVELALLLESLPPGAELTSPPPAPLNKDTPCPCGSDTPFALCHGAEDPNAA